MANNNIDALANDIIYWCVDHGITDDWAVYACGNAVTTWDTWHGEAGKKVELNQVFNEPMVYWYGDKNPLDYFEYANPETVSMSFEGMLYEIVNDFGMEFPELWESFNKIFEKYGYYYELGNAWNLTAAEL